MRQDYVDNKNYLCRMRGVRDLMINVALFTLRGGAQLTCSAENRDFNIKNAGFVFAVEICDFSVFAYNFYSSNKYIVVELRFVQRN